MSATLATCIRQLRSISILAISPAQRRNSPFLNSHVQAASFISTTSIRCAAPSASTLPIGTVVVSAAIDGGVAVAPAASPSPEDSRSHFLFYDASLLPTITSIEPTYAPMAGGTTITVHGNNLAPTGKLACVFDELGFSPATLSSATSLRCVAPAARAPVRTALAVTLDQYSLSVPSIPFAYFRSHIAPTIEAVLPLYIHFGGGTTLTLFGSNFDPADDVAACIFTPTGDAEPIATPASHITNEQMLCSAPPFASTSTGTARVSLWSITSDGSLAGASLLDAAQAAAADPEGASPSSLSSSSVPLVVYDATNPPVLSRLSHIYASLSTVGSLAQVEVVGFNFAPSDSELQCGLQGSSTISLATFINSTAVRCALPPPDKPSDVGLRVTANGGTSWSNTLRFTFYEAQQPPSVLGVPPSVDVADQRLGLLHIDGLNFAPTAGLRCGFGGFHLDSRDIGGRAVAMTTATFVSSTEVLCVPPSIWWQVAHVHVTNDGGTYWSDAGPTISVYNTSQPAIVRSVSPSALPVGGSEELLSLRGEFFFRPSTQVGLHVCRFDGLPNPGTTSVPARQLSSATIVDATHARCATPEAGRPHTALVSLSFDGGDTFGLGAQLTFFDGTSPPLVVAVQPPSGQRDRATTVTLSGSNFAPASTEGALVCRFGQATSAATFIHSTALTCRAPPALAFGAVVLDLSINGGLTWTQSSAAALATSGDVSFVYFDASISPTISSIFPAGAPTGGGVVLTMQGSNFVPTMSSHSGGAQCILYSSGRPLATSPATQDSFSTVRCVSPIVDSGSSDATLYLQSPEQQMSLGTPFTFYDATRPPTITSLEPNGLPLGAPPATVRVGGTGFAPVDLKCIFGSDAPSPATFMTSTLLVCNTPASPPIDAPTSISLAVSRSTSHSSNSPGGGASTTFTYYDANAVGTTTFAMPRAVDIRGGTSITVTGHGFRPAGYEMSCAIGGLHVPAFFVSLTKVTCNTPMAEKIWNGAAASVRVCVVYGAANAAACDATITYYDPTQPPKLISLAPRMGALGSKALITLSGTNVAPTGSALVCRFTTDAETTEASPPVSATFQGGDSARCEAPLATLPATAHVQLSTDGGRTYSSPALPFAHYDSTKPPTIAMVEPRVAGLDSRKRIQLTGDNFAPTATFACRFGNLPVAPATFISSTKAVCRAPPSSSVHTVGLAVSLDGASWSSNPTQFTFYDTSRPPAVANLSHAFGSIDGSGPPLVVAGSNFAPTGAALRCRFLLLSEDGHDDDLSTVPSSTSVPATFISTNQMRCAAPSMAHTGTAAVSASNDGLTFGASTAVYTVYAPNAQPVVSRVTPSYGPYTRTTSVTIYGSNFAPTAGLRVRWGGLGTTPAIFRSGSSAVATAMLPPSNTRSLSVPVELDFDGSFPNSPAAESSWKPLSLFTYFNPYYPPVVKLLTPSQHRCADGGSWVDDVRSGERVEVSTKSYVSVHGENFAPRSKLSCVYRRTGETLFDSFERTVPARFISYSQIACPIPTVRLADDGLHLSSKMFFSVSNDGEIYRYSNWTFTFVGGCEASSFTRTMATIVLSLASLIGLALSTLALLVVCRRRAPRDAVTFVTRFLSSLSSSLSGSRDAVDDNHIALTEPGTLSLEVQSATHLPMTREGRPPEAYVKVRSAGSTAVQTKIAPRSSHPVWDEVLQLEGTLADLLEVPLLLSVRHAAAPGARDETIGDVILDVGRLATLRKKGFLEMVDARLKVPSSSGALGSAADAALTFKLTWTPAASIPARSRPGWLEHLFSPDRAANKVQFGARQQGWQLLVDDDEEDGQGGQRLGEQGTLEVLVHRAAGLLAADKNGLSDPYVIVQLGEGKLWRSRVVPKTLDPVWEESYLVSGALRDTISSPLLVTVMDRDRGQTTDDYLGELTVDLVALRNSDVISIDQAPLVSGGSGTLSLDVKWKRSNSSPARPMRHSRGYEGASASDEHLPPLERCLGAVGRAGAALDQGIEWVSSGCRSVEQRLSSRGVLLVTVHAARDLDGSLPYVILRLHGHKVWRSRTEGPTTRPSWEQTYSQEGVLAELIRAPLTVKVMDGADGATNATLGGLDLSLDALRSRDEIPAEVGGLRLNGCASGHGVIFLSVRWHAEGVSGTPGAPATIYDSGGGGDVASVPPASPRLVEASASAVQALTMEVPERLRQPGTLEVMIIEADGLHPTSGTCNPYVTLKLPGQTLWKSCVASDTSRPLWNEVMRAQGSVADFVTQPMVLKVVDRAMAGATNAYGGLSVRLDALKTASAIDFFRQPLGGSAHGAVVSFTVVFTPDVPIPSSPPRSPPRELSAMGTPPPIGGAPLAALGGNALGGSGTAPSSAPVSPSSSSRLAQRGTFEAQLVRATALMAADANGTSDPYVTIKVTGFKTWKSSVQQKTINPVWDETMRREGARGDFARSTMQVKVFDKDFMGMGDDRLGNKRVSLAKLESTDYLELSNIPLDDATSGSISINVRFVPS